MAADNVMSIEPMEDQAAPGYADFTALYRDNSRRCWPRARP